MKKRAQPGKSPLYDTSLPLEQRRQWMLDYTIARYTTKNRSVRRSGRCLYAHPRHVGCAIGVHLPKALRIQLDSSKGAEVKNDFIFNALPVALQDLGRYFLQAIQTLHDLNSNWTSAGLSAQGLIEAQSIAASYYCRKDPTKQTNKLTL